MALGGTIPLMMKAAAAGSVSVPTKSLRFNDGDTPSLSRTYTSNATWTLSVWVKRGELGATNNLLGTVVQFNSSDQLVTPSRTTASVYRDPAAFYHICVSDSGLYVNGEQVTSSDSTSALSDAKVGDSFDGYLFDVYFIDGTALTPTSFAEEDGTTGQWKPIAYSGSYGDEGFHLDFENDTDIGNDVSGNNNDFTANNLAASDVVEDIPTDNYCVYNGVFAGATGLSEGNLKCTTTTRGTFDAMSFASYWEIEANTTSVVGGVISEGGTANTVSVTNGSTFGFRLSAAGALDYTSNGASWTSITTGLSGEQFPYVTGGTTTANFGQSTLSYSVPSGYAVLSTGNLPTPTIKKGVTYFDTKLYDDGDGAKTFDNGTVSMQPDLVWVKSRGSAYDHKLTDSVRGTEKALESNTIDTEATDPTGLTAFGSDGFTVGADTNYSDTTGVGMVAWAWKKSATAGFNIVGWTGDDDVFSGGTQPVAHGLGVAPEMVIAKNRTDEAGGNGNWIVYHKDTSSGDLLKLNSIDGEFTPNNTLIGSIGSTNVSFGNDSVDSEYLNSDNSIQGGEPDTYISYFFASVEGYSKVGVYSGNSSADGPFVYCGFRPAFLIMKWVGGVSDWYIYDSTRSPYNELDLSLKADSSGTETTFGSLDLLSGGFKWRMTDSARNASGESYIYAAFAESPFKYANAR